MNMPHSGIPSGRIVVIGGVTAGVTAATKARRENESAEIIVLERGPYVSFATCGLPYHLAGDIEHRSALLLQSPETLLERYNLDVRPGHEVTSIDRAARTVRIRLTEHAREAVTPASHRDCPDPAMSAGTEFSLAWDRLILATGSSPLVPGIPGSGSPHCFSLWTMHDMDCIDAWIKEHKPKTAAIMGAGMIGLEIAEALTKRGLKVCLVESAAAPLAWLDPEFSQAALERLTAAGLDIQVSSAILEIDARRRTVLVQAHRGTTGEPAPGPARSLGADLVILAAESRPNTQLALGCGLEIGHSGGLVVGPHLQTSRDPDIFVAGDLAEIPFKPDKRPLRLPLAGPANRQGRIAGANAARSLLKEAPDPESYPGAVGTSIVRCLGCTVAAVGLDERSALASGLPTGSAIIHRTDQAPFCRGARALSLKITYHLGNGRLLGAQVLGDQGVDKRIDVLATAIHAGMSVRDLADLDLAYAPPFNSASDPVNYAGMVAANNLSGFCRSISPAEFLKSYDPRQDLALDVRMPSEHANGAVPGSLNIPIDELRHRFGELPRDRRVLYAYCAVGFRGHLAVRILAQHGFGAVVNISGGWSSLKYFFNPAQP
jgi:NADPH-dependent 2,4-dienoyl-CoA reductase/sulfur reductase-like enzyme/rhodanese-related sulfurtransferase